MTASTRRTRRSGGWHAPATTTPADLAPFRTDDLDEAEQRLRRLAQVRDVRLRALPDDVLDRDDGRGWTFRQLAWHVAESAFSADSVGVVPAVPEL